jgi:uncharacterized protein
LSRRRLFTFVYAVTAASHALVLLALTAFLSLPLALFATAVVGGVTVWRLGALKLDPRRAGWVVRAVDEPLLCHWVATILAATPFVAGLFVAFAASVAGLAPSALSFVPQIAAASYLVGLVAAAWGTWGERRRVRVRTFDVAVPGLGAELDGYRVVQLSDLHVGSFDPRSRGLQWVERANALAPDLAVVTGDLVTVGTHYYDDAAEVVGGLRAVDGTLVALGNHDQWEPARLVEALASRGATVLRNAFRVVHRGGARLVVAGLDDRYARRDDLDRTLADRPEGVPTLLLAHYPDSFPAAAARGVELVLSGHTHGGQIGLPFIAERLHIGTLSGQRGRGFVRSGQSLLYVNAGLGTTGPPVRLGIPPEIALFVLRSEPAGKG